jgi:hypothetical protein
MANQTPQETWGQWGSRLFAGTPAYTQQFSRYTPEIQQDLNQQIQQLLSGQGKTPMEQQTLRQFKSDILPNINERYAGMGASSSQNAAQENAGSNLAQNLQGDRLQMLMQLLQAGQQENTYFKSQPGIAQQIIPAAAQVAGAYFNPGGGILDQIKNMFGGGGAQEGQNGQEGIQPSQQQQYNAPQQLNARDRATQSIFDQLIAHNAGNIYPKQQQGNPTDPFSFQGKPTYQLGGPGTRSVKPGTNNLLWLQNYLQSQRPGGPQGGLLGQMQ